MDRNKVVFFAISNKSIESVQYLCITSKKKNIRSALCHSTSFAGINICNTQNQASENKLPEVSCFSDKLGTFAKLSVGCFYMPKPMPKLVLYA